MTLCTIVNAFNLPVYKVGHLIKIVSEDIFHFLCVKGVMTLEEILDVRRYLEAFDRDCLPLSGHERLSNVHISGISGCHDFDTDVGRVVREGMREMEKIMNRLFQTNLHA